jgi:hypothetical protein
MSATANATPPELRVVQPEPPLLRVVPTADEAHERVARALRGARARTGLAEQQVVDKLAARGFELGLAALRDAESAGVLELSLASALADLYGTTTDCLAGRRIGRQQPSLSALPTAGRRD